MLADLDGSRDRAFNDAQIIAGRACRDAHARTCRWHLERGMEVPAGMRCGTAARHR